MLTFLTLLQPTARAASVHLHAASGHRPCVRTRSSLLYVWPAEGLCRGPSQGQSEGQGGFLFFWRFISARHDNTRQSFLQGHERFLFPLLLSWTHPDTHAQRGKLYSIRLFSARPAAAPRQRLLLPRPPPHRPLPRRSELSSTMRRAIADKDSHRHDVSLFAHAFCTGPDAVLYPKAYSTPESCFRATLRRFLFAGSLRCSLAAV